MKRNEGWGSGYPEFGEWRMEYERKCRMGEGVIRDRTSQRERGREREGKGNMYRIIVFHND